MQRSNQFINQEKFTAFQLENHEAITQMKLHLEQNKYENANEFESDMFGIDMYLQFISPEEGTKNWVQLCAALLKAGVEYPPLYRYFASMVIGMQTTCVLAGNTQSSEHEEAVELPSINIDDHIACIMFFAPYIAEGIVSYEEVCEAVLAYARNPNNENQETNNILLSRIELFYYFDERIQSSYLTYKWRNWNTESDEIGIERIKEARSEALSFLSDCTAPHPHLHDRVLTAIATKPTIKHFNSEFQSSDGTLINDIILDWTVSDSLPYVPQLLQSNCNANTTTTTQTVSSTTLATSETSLFSVGATRPTIANEIENTHDELLAIQKSTVPTI